MRRKPHAFAMVELLICLLIVVVLAALTMSSVRGASERANRAKCLINLKQIGTAMRVYETMNNGQFPRTIAAPVKNDADYAVTWGTGAPDGATNGSRDADPFARHSNREAPAAAHTPKDNDVTAAFYLLIRTVDFPSELFVCPTTRQKPWDYGGGDNRAEMWTNWPGTKGIAAHLSYSFQNMYPSQTAVQNGFAWNSGKLISEFAIASDMNPGGDAVLLVTVSSNATEMQKANSLNHYGEGQNVLYGDCHAEWMATPFSGVGKDNIFTARTKPDARPDIGGEGAAVVIVGSPISDSDSILLPTAAEVGVKGPPVRQPKANPRSADELRKLIAGTYHRVPPLRDADGRPRELVLTIGDNSIVGKMGPVTITLGFAVTGETEDGAILLQITGEGIAAAAATLELSPDNNTLNIESDEETQSLNGQWRRGAPPASRPTTQRVR